MNMLLEFLIFSMSAACLAMPLFWVYRRTVKEALPSPIEPVWVLILFVLIGVNLKLFYIQFIRPDDVVALFYGTRDRMLQDGGMEVFLPGLLALLVAIPAFLVGYSKCTKGYQSPEAIENYSFNQRRLFVAIGVILGISILAFASFVLYEYWYVSGENVSQKRFNSLEGGATNRLFHMQYYAYKLSTFARYGFYLVLIYLLSRKDQVANSTIVLLLLLYVMTVFVPSYFGNRAHVLVLLIDISIVFFLNQSRRNALLYATLFFLSIAIILVTTVRRQGTMAPKAKFIASELLKVKEYQGLLEDRKAELSRLQTQLTKELAKDEAGRIIEDIKFKLAFYHRCHDRIVDTKLIQKKYADEDHPYWRKRAYWIDRASKVAPAGTGVPTMPVRAIDSLFKSGEERDVCSGGIDLIENYQAAKPLHPLYSKVLGITERFMQGRYFIDILKTSHLVRKVPSEMGYLYGQSLVGWVFAPVPRSIWPDKPLFMQVPPMISTIVFDEPTNNVPAGIVAETFINFGWPGLILGMFAVGYALRYIYNSLQLQQRSIIVQMVYAIIAVRMTVILFNSSLGTAILKTVIDLGPLLLALWFVSERKEGQKLMSTLPVPGWLSRKNKAPSSAE